jgi:hypothetical protein
MKVLLFGMIVMAAAIALGFLVAAPLTIFTFVGGIIMAKGLVLVMTDVQCAIARNQAEPDWLEALKTRFINEEIDQLEFEQQLEEGLRNPPKPLISGELSFAALDRFGSVYTLAPDPGPPNPYGMGIRNQVTVSTCEQCHITQMDHEGLCARCEKAKNYDDAIDRRFYAIDHRFLDFLDAIDSKMWR